MFKKLTILLLILSVLMLIPISYINADTENSNDELPEADVENIDQDNSEDSDDIDLDALPEDPEDDLEEAEDDPQVDVDDGEIESCNDLDPSEVLKIKCEGEDVINLQMRLRDLGYFNYKVTGYYADATRGAVALFQEENGLTIDGTVGPETKDVLYSSEAKRHTAIPTLANEYLPASRGGVASMGVLVDWFEQGQYLFPRESVAKVIDLYTGKSFMMKRTGGTYHADSEPVSSADSEMIKEIWGGWSWARRPIIVEASGVRIAASMNGMPHAFDRIPNNGMDGHVCIHMYNSKTHIRSKPDPDHQAMVRRAAGK